MKIIDNVSGIEQHLFFVRLFVCLIFFFMNLFGFGELEEGLINLFEQWSKLIGNINQGLGT